MRDDATAKVRDANKRHECRVHVILFFSSCRLSRGNKANDPESKMDHGVQLIFGMEGYIKA
jgi:hypothetical protein